MCSSFKTLVFAILLAIAGLSTAGQVFAQASDCGKERKDTGGVLDEVTYKRLNDIYEDVGNELYDVAYD